MRQVDLSALHLRVHRLRPRSLGSVRRAESSSTAQVPLLLLSLECRPHNVFRTEREGKEIMDSKGKSAVECDAISGERRQHRRYLLEMELRWKLIRRRRVLETGIGHTIDLSSGGILFNAGRPLPAGHNVELSISWPVLLNDAVPLQLAAKGRIVRDNGGQVAIQTMERELLSMPKFIGVRSERAKAPKPKHVDPNLRPGDSVLTEALCSRARVQPQ